MRINHVRQRLQSGEPSLGTWLSLPSPEAAEYVSSLGLDWLVIDAEHNAIDIRTLGQMFTAIATTGVAPMVRIPWNTAENIKRVLDAGAWGIVVPMVNSREEAELAVSATKYPPTGTRSVGGSRHAMTFATSASEYYAHANDSTLVVVQIEHIDGVNNADEILSVPGVDACFIGPNDLAASMGLGIGVPLESDQPKLVEAIMHIRDTCQKYGVAPGIHTSGAQGARSRIEQGFQFCALASEIKYLLAGLGTDLDATGWTASERSHRQAGTPAENGTVVRY
ncbi:MAG TPA: aldolase/citrate lyase family protein [Thermomicrobiales bacterium]|nr:aldolase/citrate lyase family protein [Thermomicrobiales bacterium]